jgi:putative endonuclease
MDKETKKNKHNKELGARGEEAAAYFLVRRGYDIVARNWTCFAGEADIIARDGEALVFVEVKTRSNYTKGMPGEAVGKEKRKRYEKIAAAFLAQYDVVDIPLRFDVISIIAVAPDRAMIRHHINAFAAA